jgi:para-nitrobenzyl esterase
MLAIVALALGVSTMTHAAPLTVKTEQGKVRGKTINDGKVQAFLGLPYAAPPVGDLRWRAPQPPAKREGERDATSFGAHCAQNRIWDDFIFLDSGASEDCLFLNVYAPAVSNANSKLPVMLWIHGGGYAAGASSEPRHNGDFLPLKGVVLVTINYRLGVFGFLATSDLAHEANGAAGNYGLQDMVAALEWVKANVRNFGGDPGNVTIFGESAGSFAVSTLMASPAARGLFHRAIGESGAAFGDTLSADTLEAREKKDGEWVASLGVKSLEELRAVPTGKILDAVKSRGIIGFSPVIDGKLLVEPVAGAYAAGKQAHVPLLAGWNRDEGRSRVNEMTAEKWKAYAEEHYKERSAEFLKLYPADTDAQALRSAIDYGGDAFIAFGTWKWIEAQRNTGAPTDRSSSVGWQAGAPTDRSSSVGWQAGAPTDRSSSVGWQTGDSPVYRYRFDLASPPSKFHLGSFAFHSDDIEYVFGTLDTRPGAVWRPEDRKLSEQMMSYWTNFARTGDPNGTGLPPWPKYDSADSLIHLDSTITSGPDTLRPRYEFLLKGMPPFHF